VGYGLVTKSLGAGCTFEEVRREKTKCQKMNVNPFTTKLRWIISPNFEKAKSLEDTILYNDSQHNIPALQSGANKTTLWSQNVEIVEQSKELSSV
jgi:hypothetical protein